MLAEVSEKDKEAAVRREMLAQMKAILKEKRLDYVRFFVVFVREILAQAKFRRKKGREHNEKAGRSSNSKS